MSRWAVVDDVSSGGISYGGETGAWSVIDGMLDGTPAGGGPPLYNTLHETHSNASLSYTFKGSSFVVVGSHFSASMPQWTCSIDGDELATFSNSSGGNNLHLCANTLTDGTHTVILNISATEDEPFWFDYIQFLPSADTSLDQADVVYGTDDSLIQCDASWDPMQVGTMTMKTGSTMFFDFNGVSLSWFGVYNSSHSGGSAIATYSVDGETPIPFTLDNLSSDDVPFLSNQLFFQTSEYTTGQHRLEVVYQGHPETTPLTLEHLIVQDSSPNTPTTSTVTAVTTSTMLPTASTSSKSSSHSMGGTNSRLIGSIIGGAIGGFLFLGLLAMTFCFLRRCSSRRRKSHPEEAFRDVIEPYTHNPLLRSSGYDPLPTSTTKRPIQVGDSQTGHERQVSSALSSTLSSAPRRSIIRSLVEGFTHATFGSTHSHREATTLLPSNSSRHARTSSSWIVVHEDSGIRLLSEVARSNTDIVEIPPTYSAE